MRAVYMGTPDFAVPPLQALLREHEVLAAVTQPDKPKGRGGAVQCSPVKEAALAAHVPVFQPKSVKEAGFLSQMSLLQPDVIVVAAFGQIIPPALLKLSHYGCLNIHASLLPRYRGAAPIQWAVINGDPTSGVTVMQMNEGLDTGDILLQREIPLAPDETGGSLFDKLSVLGAEALLDALDALPEGGLTPVRQPEESPTPYAAMLTKEMGHIDWNKSAEEIERLVRGLNPWPSAYTRLEGKTLKIWRAHVQAGGAGAPGEVTAVGKKEFGVQTKDGLLMIDALQLEGKKRMETDAFLRGFAIKPGTLLV